MLNAEQSETNASRWLKTAGWILRIAVAIHLLGLFIAVHTRAGTAIGGIALMDWGVAHDTIFAWEKGVTKILLLLGISLLVFPTFPIALIVGAAILANSYAAYKFGGEPFYEWSVWSNTLRWGAPLALAVLAFPTRWIGGEATRARIVSWMLRIMIAIVFVVHGLQAWFANPVFIDLMIGTARRLFDYRLTESNAVTLLKAIAVLDIIVAALLLAGRWRPLLGWLAFWGLITAVSRVTALGIMSYPEILVRASHYLTPLAVWGFMMYEMRSRQTQDNEFAVHHRDGVFS